MKTIGILGGLGPQATIDFEQRLHRAAQRLAPQRGDVAYPPLVSWFFRELPVLIAADSPQPVERPPVNPRLLEAARALGGHMDFLAIPSNGVHLWQAEIEAAAGKPVVSMVDAVVAEVERRGCRHVGLVDFRPSAWGVYPPRLEQLGVRWAELPSRYRDTLAGVMRAVNAGRNGTAEEAQLRLAIALLRARHSDGIILACTEFPLALTGALEPDLISPMVLTRRINHGEDTCRSGHRLAMVSTGTATAAAPPRQPGVRHSLVVRAFGQKRPDKGQDDMSPGLCRSRRDRKRCSAPPRLECPPCQLSQTTCAQCLISDRPPR